MDWTPHGDTQISIYDNIIKNKPTGSFNKEGIVKVWNEIYLIIQEKGWKCWFLIEEVHALSTPDALALLNSMYEKAESLGCQAICVIYNSVIQKKIMTTILNESSLPVKFVDSVNDAMEFFHSMEE